MQRVCSSCGQDPGTGGFCQHCGNRLTDTGEPPAQADEVQPAQPAQPTPPPPPAQQPVPGQPVPAAQPRSGRRMGCLITALVLVAVVAGGGLLGWRWFESNVLPSIMGTQEVFDQFEELEGLTAVPGPPGPCFDLDIAGGLVTEWTEVPCDGPRDVEAFFWAEFPDGAFPGDDYLATAADDTCSDAFAVYVGASVSQSQFAVNWLVPSSGTWENGDRQAVCLVVSGTGAPLTGTVKGSET